MTTAHDPNCTDCLELARDLARLEARKRRPTLADNACWECGKPAPDGICFEPHPRFSLIGAVAARNIHSTEPISGSSRP